MNLAREILICSCAFIAGFLICSVFLNFPRAEAEPVEVVQMPFTVEYHVNWDEVDDVGLVFLSEEMIEETIR